MKRQIYKYSLYILLFVTNVCADSIQRNTDGTIFDPHITIKIDSSQISELEIFNTISFNKQQIKILTEKGMHFPLRLNNIFPIGYSDCTCESGFFGIRNDAESIILIESKTNNFLSSYLSSIYISGGSSFKIIITGTDEIYVQGIKTNLQELATLISHKKTLFKREKKIFASVINFSQNIETKKNLLDFGNSISKSNTELTIYNQ
jgi:hypothetical protein